MNNNPAFRKKGLIIVARAVWFDATKCISPVRVISEGAELPGFVPTAILRTPISRYCFGVGTALPN